MNDKSQFIIGKTLNMEKILEKFIQHFNDVYGNQPDGFKEAEGRKLFMLYLRPIINGTGNYYIEAQTRDQKRTDMIIDYFGQQYVIELKIWHGDEYNTKGEKQIADYLEEYHLEKGYLLSSHFNKNKKTVLKTAVSGLHRTSLCVDADHHHCVCLGKRLCRSVYAGLLLGGSTGHILGMRTCLHKRIHVSFRQILLHTA